MMINVLEYLENSAELYPDKTAVKDDAGECSYRELKERALRIGTALTGYINRRDAVMIFAPKSVQTLQAFMGTVYAGGFYVPVEPTFPVQRIRQIFGVLKPKVIVTRREYLAKLEETGCDAPVLTVEDIGAEIDKEALSRLRGQCLDTDPLYGIFTSGSTGIPKGVLVCHRSVIDFIDNFTELFGIDETDVIGNQAPFDFDVSVKDIYSALKKGATLVIIPREFFMFPMKVMDMLDENGVTTLIWAVSALCMLNRLHGLKYKVPGQIRRIMFSGEMMPVKQLNQWRGYYPEALFVNLYGPTEITCNCTYYVIDREYEDTEKLPIGNAFPNERVFLLDENDGEITQSGKNGELCVSGTALALGYLNNPEQTAKVFVQNPLNSSYPELIYRTGDLAYYDDDGRLVFAGRKDFQIKHMGHRIELEEIDAALNSLCGVERACTFFDEDKNKIVAFYVGESERGDIIDAMKTKVPEFMVPNVFIQVEEMPLTKNGKLDRGHLKDLYRGGKNGV
ncbi:MAG: amino acid adenylation domain-containing protein [Butyrivibrio sp.]|nr:amino acid adenylation domain-containing protein [Butyrivibrio sp.]